MDNSHEISQKEFIDYYKYMGMYIHYAFGQIIDFDESENVCNYDKIYSNAIVSKTCFGGFCADIYNPLKPIMIISRIKDASFRNMHTLFTKTASPK